MEFNQIDADVQTNKNNQSISLISEFDLSAISLKAEVPEALYLGMKDFISNNSKWDQSKLISSAIANFLFQNGSNDRDVIEQYLNDIFNLSKS